MTLLAATTEGGGARWSSTTYTPSGVGKLRHAELIELFQLGVRRRRRRVDAAPEEIPGLHLIAVGVRGEYLLRYGHSHGPFLYFFFLRRARRACILGYPEPGQV